MRDRVAIDIGGTFIDPVVQSPGKPFTLSKVLSISEDLVSGLGGSADRSPETAVLTASVSTRRRR